MTGSREGLPAAARTWPASSLRSRRHLLLPGCVPEATPDALCVFQKATLFRFYHTPLFCLELMSALGEAGPGE